MGIKRTVNIKIEKTDRPSFDDMMLESILWMSETMLENSGLEDIPAPDGVKKPTIGF